MSDDNPVMLVAWRDFLSFAIGHDALRTAFERETGSRFPAEPTSVIDALIDRSTGHEDAVIRDFAFWATLTQWGDDGVPAAFIGEASARFPALAASRFP